MSRTIRPSRAQARHLAPTLPQLWALASLTGIFIFLNLRAVNPEDFWWHVRAGQWMVDNGRVPTTDLFSFTRAGQPWSYQSWLMQVAFYLLLRTGDLPLVILFDALVITAAYGLLFRVNRQAAGGDARWAALATLAAAALGFDNWNVRPQTISILLFVLTLTLLERTQWRQELGDPTPWTLWLLVPLFALWANAHGAFVMGLALVGAHLLASLLTWLRRQRPFPTQLLLVALLGTAATLLSPLGTGMIDYVLSFVRHPVTRTMNLEFMAPTVRTLGGGLFFAYAAILIALLVISRYRPTPREWTRILLFAVLALMAQRNVIWFGIVAAPTLAAALHHWAARRGIAPSTRAGRPRINWVLAAMLGLLALLSLPWFRPHLPWPQLRRAYLSPGTPVGAVAFLRELPSPPRAFHGEGYGSYMIWASPGVPVFIDTRFELYPPEQWYDYLALRLARYDWERILERYGVDTLLLEREKMEPLIEAASAAPRWHIAYEDELAAVFQLEEER